MNKCLNAPLAAALVGVCLWACTDNTGGEAPKVGTSTTGDVVDVQPGEAAATPDAPVPKLTCKPLSGYAPHSVCCAIEPGIPADSKLSRWFVTIDWGDGHDAELTEGELPNTCHVFTTPGGWLVTAKVIYKADGEVSGKAQTQVAVGVALDTSGPAEPDLTSTNVSLGVSGGSVSPGEVVSASWKVGNLGGKAGKFRVALYLSADKAITLGDIKLTEASTSTITGLGAGAVLPLARSIIVPQVADGTWYVIARADDKDDLKESDETNNNSPQATPLVVKKALATGPDLELQVATAAPSIVAMGTSIAVTIRVRSAGTVAAPTTKGRIYLCKGPFSPSKCVWGKTTFDVPALASGQIHKTIEYAKTTKSMPGGLYTVYVQLDADDAVAEALESNNTKSAGEITVVANAAIDLYPSGIGVHPTTAGVGDMLKVGYKILNAGKGHAPPFKTRVVLAATGKISLAEAAAGKYVTLGEFVYAKVLGAGATLHRSHSVAIPKLLDHAVGKWHLAVIVDSGGAVDETDELNNVGVVAATIAVSGAVGGCFDDAHEKAGNDTAGKATVLKAGAHKALSSCGDDDWYGVQLKAGQRLDVSVAAAPIDVLPKAPGSGLALSIHDPAGKPVVSGTQSASALTATVAAAASPGLWLIRVRGKTAASRATYTLGIKLQDAPAGVDLAVVGVTAKPDQQHPGGMIVSTLGLANQGKQATGAPTVLLYSSADTKLDGGDAKLGEFKLSDGFKGLSSTQLTRHMLTSPLTKAGTWRVIARIKADAGTTDVDTANNVGVSPPPSRCSPAASASTTSTAATTARPRPSRCPTRHSSCSTSASAGPPATTSRSR